ncbi:MAG: N-acetylglucosamine-6-phosphate deacetylase [Eubacteriales bacterium]|nr:N-acetylglucosamine-6-phosphate deacetylase [Eubacteriales bacterium]
MKITNVNIYCEDHTFRRGSVHVEHGRIAAFFMDENEEVGDDQAVSEDRRSSAFRNRNEGQGDKDYENENHANENHEIYDGKGAYLIPGLIDIHFHGCMGIDFCDALPDGLAQMAAYEASVGVTSICPASMTMSKEELHGIMKMAGEYEEQKIDEYKDAQKEIQTDGYAKKSHFVGINMEGPFISEAMKGAQAEENIIPCDVEFFRQLQEESGGKIRLVDIAPEEAGAMEFIEELADEVNISIAHTQSDYDTAMEAFSKGTRHVTHLYNAMTPLHHRNPGVIAAAADSHAEVEIICDGIHVHPSIVRNTFRMFDADKICLISDSMRATGLSDGEYTLGGQKVYVKGALATLEDGTIAGSVTNLMDCMKNVVQKMGIPLETAIACATENPAKCIGIFDEYGSITIGKHADLVLLDEELKVLDVFVDGEKVK